MRRFFQRLATLPKWLRIGIAIFAIGIVLGFLGPFGSYLSGTYVQRIAYWIIAITAGILFYWPGVRISHRFLAGHRGLTFVARSIWILAAGVPQTAFTRFCALSFWPELAQHKLSWIDWYLQSTLLAALLIPTMVAFTKWAPFRASESRSSILPASGYSAEESDLFGGDVIALAMEDHYVRIHRKDASTLALVPLARAMTYVSTIEGMQTHRSWWVARDAVVRVEGNARAMRLVLINGVCAPVSRRAVSILRSAGWLRQ